MVKKYEYKPLEFDGDDGEGMEVWVEWDGNYFPARLREKRDDSYWCFFPDGVPWGVTLRDYDLFYRDRIFTRHEVEEPEPREPREWWMNVTSMRCYAVASPLRAVLVREVMPPVVKERPDSEGLWFRNGCVQRFEIRNGEWFTFSRDWGYWKSAEQLPKGN